MDGHRRDPQGIRWDCRPCLPRAERLTVAGCNVIWPYGGTDTSRDHADFARLIWRFEEAVVRNEAQQSVNETQQAWWARLMPRIEAVLLRLERRLAASPKIGPIFLLEK